MLIVSSAKVFKQKKVMEAYLEHLRSMVTSMGV